MNHWVLRSVDSGLAEEQNAQLSDRSGNHYRHRGDFLLAAIGKAGQACVEQQLNNLGDNFVADRAAGARSTASARATHDTITLTVADAQAINTEVSLINSVSPNVDDPVQVV